MLRFEVHALAEIPRAHLRLVVFAYKHLQFQAVSTPTVSSFVCVIEQHYRHLPHSFLASARRPAPYRPTAIDRVHVITLAATSFISLHEDRHKRYSHQGSDQEKSAVVVAISESAPRLLQRFVLLRLARHSPQSDQQAGNNTTREGYLRDLSKFLRGLRPGKAPKCKSITWKHIVHPRSRTREAAPSDQGHP